MGQREMEDLPCTNQCTDLRKAEHALVEKACMAYVAIVTRGRERESVLFPSILGREEATFSNGIKSGSGRASFTATIRGALQPAIPMTLL